MTAHGNYRQLQPSVDADPYARASAKLRKSGLDLVIRVVDDKGACFGLLERPKGLAVTN